MPGGDDHERHVHRDQQQPPVQSPGSAQSHPQAHDRHQSGARHRDRPGHDRDRGQRRQQPDTEISDRLPADDQVHQGDRTAQRRPGCGRGLAADRSEHRERHTQNHDRRDSDNSPAGQHPRQPWTSSLR